MFLDNSAEKLETKTPKIAKSVFPITTNIAKAPNFISIDFFFFFQNKNRIILKITSFCIFLTQRAIIDLLP